MFFIGIFTCGFNQMMHYFDIFLMSGYLLKSFWAVQFEFVPFFVKKSDNIRHFMIGIELEHESNKLK